MKNKIHKILRFTIASLMILSLCAAPALQAVQISEVVAQLSQSCKCCCCGTAEEEKTCAVISIENDDRCGCKVDNQDPINSAPIVSTASNSNHNELAANSSYPAALIVSIVNETNLLVEIDYPPQKHPPLFILNASLLI